MTTSAVRHAGQAPRTGSSSRPLKWWHGWPPLLLLPGGVVFLAASNWPRWAFMWVLAGSIYVGCKWLTWRRTPTNGVPFWKHVGYLLAWPGLDAATFLTKRSTSPPNGAEWAFGVAKFALGIALFFGAARSAPPQPYLVGWIGMVGIVLILHFGLFHLLSCAWRRIGVDARPLMDWPLNSVRLGEFWGRRWNTAFRDLTHRFLFRPLTTWVGPRGAIFAGFVFSGVVHDVVISIPARGGYGGPTLFFTIQAVAMLFERSALGRRFGLGRGWNGWVFTMAVLVAPVYWLFHPPFVENTVVPFMRVLGAI